MSIKIFVYGTLKSESEVCRVTGQKHVRYIEPALLLGFKRLSASVIIASDEDTVLGKILLNLTAEQISKLDSYEGHPYSWRREPHQALINDKIIVVDVYIPQEVILRKWQ